MRKLAFVVAFFLAGFVLSAQQNEDSYNMARQIIYGENPIGVITRVNDNALEGLSDYAMGMAGANERRLNENDAWLLSVLCLIETNRRNAASTNEFLVYLQERSEWLDTQPLSGRTGRAAGWVQAYEILIRSRQLSVGK